MNRNYEKYTGISIILLVAILSSGFRIQQIEDFKDITLGCERNDSIDQEKCSHLDSALTKIDRIGFWGSYPFSDNEKKQVELLLWMKARFEEVGHCILLDEADGIDFTPIAKGGHALMGGSAVRVHHFKKRTSSRFQDIERIHLSILSEIDYVYTKQRGNSKKIWQQYMLVDSSNEENLMLGYKALINELIDDLQKTNKNYKKYTPVFYITIDTEFKPYLKEALGKYVSPPLTVIPDNER